MPCLIAAPASGSGKTLVSLALAALARPDGQRPMVRAICLNTALLNAEQAEEERASLQTLTGLPVWGPVRHGSSGLLAALD